MRKASLSCAVVVAAAGSQTAAVIPAQSPESFTVSAPFQVDLMTTVAVR